MTGRSRLAGLARRITGTRPLGDWSERVAVVIASHDGELTLPDTIASVAGQARVYVVSDGSTDRTAEVARAAGATVLELEGNVGKPRALYEAIRELELTKRYEAIAILDDDTIVSEDFVAQSMAAMDPEVAIVVGQTISRWEHPCRWNVWVGSRAYSYWRYQATLRRGQSAFNVMNCISGSNSVYRAEVLDAVLVEDTPYIVDDTFWTLEVHRRGLGRIVYRHQAKAWICDPTTFRAWYRQNLRWLWGTLQGVRGHRVGTRLTRFDLAYVALIGDWFVYVAAAPGFGAFGVAMGWFDPVRFAILYGLALVGWVAVAAVATKHYRLILLTPVIVAVDWLYRLSFVHAAVLAWRRPQVEICRWDSPARY